jgi:uncharacterized protein YggT (Ycf19 family)
MSHPELLLIGILRALTEVALLSLLGLGLVGLLSGARRQSNPIYQLFQIVTNPVVRLVRKIAPPQVIDKHLPVVAFFVLFWLWIGLAWMRQSYCASQALQC